MLVIYNIIYSVLLPIIVIYRILKKKEDWRYLNERLGYNLKTRPKGTLIWIHASSVGESLIALALINNLKRRYYNITFLLTSTTITSRRLITNKIKDNVIHQYIPLDHFLCVTLFLKKWRPNLALIIEEELWPNLLFLTKRYCNIILCNGRLSNKSYTRWKKYKYIAMCLLKNIDLIITQSNNDFNKYKSLGVKKAINLGNIKYCLNPEINQEELKILKNTLQHRLVISAISTHIGDEEILIKNLSKLKKIDPNLILILAPRHPYRCKEILKLCEFYKYNIAIRSKNSIDSNTDIYLVDTIGEIGLINNLSKITIIGGSFNNTGGHNLLEAAWHNTVIIFGPDMSNFQEIALTFIQAKAALQVKNKTELIRVLLDLSQVSPNKLKSYWTNAKKLISNQSNTILNSYINLIDSYLDKANIS